MDNPPLASPLPASPSRASPPPPTSSRTSLVMGGFSPVPSHQALPAVPESISTSPRAPQLPLNTQAANLIRMNSFAPQVSTPVDQVYSFTDESPRLLQHSPRANAANLGSDYLPRSRRNSAAIVSISLSSRSRSRTPQGSVNVPPGTHTAHGTPSKKYSEEPVEMSDSWAPGVEEMDDWQPTGGMLLDHGEDEVARVESQVDDDKVGRTWSGDSDASRIVEDVLTHGMVIGEGLKFQGEVIVPAVSRMALADGSDVGLPLRRGGSEATKVLRTDGRTEKKRYEVVRRLGTGSYAVVYLVKERGGKREFALKCLSKHDLADEQLETQLFEAHIHLSLPIHQNIVTLHQTLQTRKWLFLMLELCPGEDLFYWLEKSRDASPKPNHAPLPEDQFSSSKLSSSSIPFSSSQMFSNLNSIASPASLIFAHHNGGSYGSHFMPSQTPPTPSLLSAFSANTLLSQRRLRLIASMFSQMCEAVAVCHDAGVSHRDIKPENFICCDSPLVDFGPQAKRKVVVKLTDFGLATTERESGDVECGSKPYMSYECRNNLGPTYFPAPADVWSLGIVLINMLFHRNPWKDPAPGDPNFDSFLNDPIAFILTKFTGIGREVASYLADHVLCIDVDERVDAREFARWVKGLPEMIGGRKAMQAMKMLRLETQKTAGGQGPLDKGVFMKSPIDQVDRPRKYSTSALTSTAPGISSSPRLSDLPPPSSLLEQPEEEREPSTPSPEASPPTPPLEPDMASATTSATRDEQTTPADASNFPSPSDYAPSSAALGADEDDRDCSRDRADADSRSLSTHKRRKRGVRKGKAAQAAAAAAADPLTQAARDELLKELASASQSLAREMSKVHTPSVDVNRIEDFPPLGVTAAQVAAEKKSKWKDMIKLSSQGNPELAALAKRMKDRDADGSMNLSAPAKLQGGKNGAQGGASRRHAYTQATMSSGASSGISSFGQASSATSVGEEDKEFAQRGRDKKSHHYVHGQDEEARAKKAEAAAAAIAGAMGPMGSFGRPSHMAPRHAHTTGSTGPTSGLVHSSKPITFTSPPPAHSQPLSAEKPQPIPAQTYKGYSSASPTSIKPSLSSVDSSTTIRTMTGTAGRSTAATESVNSMSSGATTVMGESPGHATSPNKPKLKGQISSLAKMLSGLKTKGKE
ncbi:serine/threonine protein kinase [Cryptococcus wingfieldii CBS 7118]|uniref:Serine/threonine protein kinase n=1 Tax=Cryptococcus wingfieldii CBS 7118 TaxID=1295528 RepID=A0A1E3JM90_9TREE|nr:serine/threonine protein kinase [Cryptococcus wingfieldii CBS 7118]ODO01933.1 serine/threonine protein kinase [Cryptococcus wingfieldii CBS 7118]